MNGVVKAPLLPRFLAWSVHLYTALGAVIALEALRAIVAGDARAAFFWMAAALAIDSSDVVPMFFAVQMGMLPAPWASAVAAAPLLSSAYGFCNSAAKTADFFFTGFPSYWNIAVFYLYVGNVSPAFNAVVLIALSALVFVPIGYLYPTRQPFLRPLTIPLGIAWGAVLLVVLAQLPTPSLAVVYGSLAFPVYYFALSAYLDLKRRR